MGTTFQEIAVQMAPKQKVMIDTLTEEAPILKNMPVEPSSHGLWNVYEELDSVTGADVVDLDSPLPNISSDSILQQKDLSVLGGKIKVGEDKAKKFGGKEAYFAKKMPAILHRTGMDMEASVLYNGIRAYAYANRKVQFGGGTGSTNYSILAVHWVSGEVTGLYDANGFGNGKAFDLAAMYGGNLFEDPADNNILKYGMRIKTYFGLQLVNAKYVAAIVNCDIDNDSLAADGTRTFPTAKMIDKMLLDVRAGSNTKIYCHPAAKIHLGTAYKLEKLKTVPGDKNFDTGIELWNGIPIETSYNFLFGTEAMVSS